MLDSHRLAGRHLFPAERLKQGGNHVLAVERHRTSAVAIEEGEPVATKLQLNIDAIIAGCASSHLGTNVLQVFADLQLLDAPLGPVGMSLLYRAAAEEVIDVFWLQYVREHENHSTTVETSQGRR